MRSTRSFILILVSLFILTAAPVHGQDCSKDKKCATGCCSQFGFCGTTPEHCGAGCLSTCDFKLGCDASNPCKDGTCCSKFGFCGIGKDYCSPENCAPGTVCTAKAECDPGGFGSAYVELAKCPLNVCCSKWGYCGTTKEFCGDKQVTRPSCDVGSSTVKRVVGYYEGWAARRSCQAFMPEDVPIGVYTHLNFAFASIDPVTFQVVPAEAGDVELYSRLTALKKQDPALKVYIAIGGWAFNDPGPTATVFSTLAADSSLQQNFFASLVSFMTTYNFDGVDIDWEYPGADDRNGRAVDFANFPAFIQNLKAALRASSGGRDGLSVTLPVSFWYLQHFDIVKLQLSVDFFNIMSYDLHGLWDKGNKWLGPFLNSHTNLTEIEEYLDLFWRNQMDPAKLHLGLAFYSRTFLASSQSCLAAACTFDAVGEAGPCSKDDIGGSLTNAELTDQIKAAGVSSALDQDAAVKIAVIGRKWITYDDKDTWQLKIDWARKLCIGGVMVWAVSQDYPSTITYSKQLQEVTQYMSPAVVNYQLTDGGGTDQPSPHVLRGQCYWANCGAVCATGFSGVPRKDWDARANEIMLDSTNCRGGQLRTFCCPSAQTIPKCGWFDFNNGNCGKNSGSVCPGGGQDIIGTVTAEVGSLSNACHNNRAQVACCETFNAPQGQLESVAGYDMCTWHGKPPDCAISWDYDHGIGGSLDDFCRINNEPRSFYQTGSLSGSGAEWCNKGSSDSDRPYCCKAMEDDAQWRNCAWVKGSQKSDGWCEAYCPAGTVRLAMEQESEFDACNGGAHAYCCEAVFRSEAKNADEIHAGYVASLEQVIEKGCDWDISGQLGNLSDGATKRSIAGLANFTLAGIAQRDTPHDYAGALDCSVALAGTLVMLASYDQALVQRYSNDWNRAVEEEHLYNIPATRVASSSGPVSVRELDAPLQTLWVEGVLNGVKAWNQGDIPDQCDWLWNLNYVTSFEDPDDGGRDEGRGANQLSAKRSLGPRNHAAQRDAAVEAELVQLEPREQMGAPRQFIIQSHHGANWIPDTITSSPYPNGNQGDDLLNKNLDTHRYQVESVGCGPTEYTLNIDAPKGTENKWVSEHILELQTIPRFLTAVLDGQLDQIDTFDGLPVRYITRLSPDVVKLLITPFPEFEYYSSSSLSPAELALALCGSSLRTMGMVVAHSDLNQKKTLIYDFARPVADDKWAICCGTADHPSVENGFKHIHEVMAVFDYYESPDVRSRHLNTFIVVQEVWSYFEEAYAARFPGQPISYGLQTVFKDYYKLHLERVETFARAWVRERLAAIERVWDLEFESAAADLILGSPHAMKRIRDAIWVFGLIREHRANIDTGYKMKLDLSPFY